MNLLEVKVCDSRHGELLKI